jgi:hypothetical protein
LEAALVVVMHPPPLAVVVALVVVDQDLPVHLLGVAVQEHLAKEMMVGLEEEVVLVLVEAVVALALLGEI